MKPVATNSMEAVTGVEGFYDLDVYKYVPPAPYHTWRQLIEGKGLKIEVEDNLLDN